MAWPKGKPQSEEHNRKRSKALKGRRLSPEHRKKIGEAKRGEKNPRWKGGRRRNSQGYILILDPSHPRSDNMGYVREHILVLEGKLGRPLSPGEVSHHINGIKDDNRQVNLLALPSRAEHTAYHRRAQ